MKSSFSRRYSTLLLLAILVPTALFTSGCVGYYADGYRPRYRPYSYYGYPHYGGYFGYNGYSSPFYSHSYGRGGFRGGFGSYHGFYGGGHGGGRH